MLIEEGHRIADQETPGKIRCQGADRQVGQERIERDAQRPAQPCPTGCADADRDQAKGIHCPRHAPPVMARDCTARRCAATRVSLPAADGSIPTSPPFRIHDMRLKDTRHGVLHTGPSMADQR